MPRTFAAASSLRFLATDIVDTYTFMTLAAVARATTPQPGDALINFSTSGTPGSGGDRISFEISGNTPRFQLYDTAAANPESTAAIFLANEWCIYIATLATAAGTPRFHRFRFSDATWIHEDGNAILNTPPAIGASGLHNVGEGTSTNGWVGQIDRAAYWKYPMSDGEMEAKLPRGGWASMAPWFMWESDPADDRVVTWGRDLGRGRDKLTNTASTTRYSGPPPPMRYSIQARRR